MEQAAAKPPVEQKVRPEPAVAQASPVESLRETLESATKTLAEQKQLLLDQNSTIETLTSSTVTGRCFVWLLTAPNVVLFASVSSGRDLEERGWGGDGFPSPEVLLLSSSALRCFLAQKI